MKYFVFALVIAFAVAVQGLEYTAEQKAGASKANKECRQVSGLTDEDETNLINHNHKAVDQEKIKKHFTCIAKKAQYLNDDGTFNIDEIKNKANDAKATPEELEKILACAVQKQDVEESAVHFLKCKHKAVGSLIGTKN